MSEKATHIDYKHPGHLRVVTGQQYPAFNVGQGDYMEDALCVSPNTDMYKRLYRKGLPKWQGK